MNDAARPTLLVVPGLRDHVATHWQTLLLHDDPQARGVAPMGREDLDCRRRVRALDAAVQAIEGPVVLVAHSGGTLTVAHWARLRSRRIAGALLAVPPDFETPMPAGYPTPAELQAGGWLPIPREPLPFPSITCASRNDPLASFARVEALAHDWGSRLVDLGEVGHLNPASGYGPWPAVADLIDELTRVPA